MAKNWMPWTEEEARALVRYAKTMTATEAAGLLERSLTSVRSKAKYMRKLGHNVTFQRSGERHRLAKHSDQTAELAREMSLDGYTGGEISKQLCVPLGTVYSWIAYQSRRDVPEHTRTNNDH